MNVGAYNSQCAKSGCTRKRSTGSIYCYVHKPSTSSSSSSYSSSGDIEADKEAIEESWNDIKDIFSDAYDEALEEYKEEKNSDSGNTNQSLESSNTNSSKNSSTVTPELKEFCDSYEAFMDQYIQFMKSYDATDTSALMEYAKLIEKMADFEEKSQQYLDNEDNMSDADVAYYTASMLRIDAKLMEFTATYYDN